MYEIGVMLNNLERDRLAAWRVVAELGFRIVHTNALAESWLTGPQRRRYVEAARASGLKVAAVFIGFDGQSYADIEAIRRTVGILAVPSRRAHRVAIAEEYCGLAHELGAPAVATHLGFLPDRSHPDYTLLVDAARQIADRAAGLGLMFHLETGQEPAAELLRFLKDVDRSNVGVNFDPANFLLYGTDEPLAALDTLGPFVRGIHCKDGVRPTEAGRLGREVPLGQGGVDFPRLFERLKKLGYSGPLIIEREAGPDVRGEVQAAREFLRALGA